MRSTNFIITVPQLYSSICASSTENNSYITLCFKFHETCQINQSNSLISNNEYYI